MITENPGSQISQKFLYDQKKSQCDHQDLDLEPYKQLMERSSREDRTGDWGQGCKKGEVFHITKSPQFVLIKKKKRKKERQRMNRGQEKDKKISEKDIKKSNIYTYIKKN